MSAHLIFSSANDRRPFDLRRRKTKTPINKIYLRSTSTLDLEKEEEETPSIV